MDDDSKFFLSVLGSIFLICATIFSGCYLSESADVKELETKLNHIKHMAEMGFEQQKVDKTTTTVVTEEEIIWVKQ